MSDVQKTVCNVCGTEFPRTMPVFTLGSVTREDGRRWLLIEAGYSAEESVLETYPTAAVAHVEQGCLVKAVARWASGRPLGGK